MCVIPSDMLPKLIVFARAPVRGKVKTRLACELSPDFALDLHTAMTADLLSRLEQIRASMDVELHADEITEAWDLNVIARHTPSRIALR